MVVVLLLLILININGEILPVMTYLITIVAGLLSNSVLAYIDKANFKDLFQILSENDVMRS